MLSSSLPNLPTLRSDQKVLTLTSDGDVVTEVAGLAVNLDAVVEVLLESGGVKDTVVGGAREVDEELVGGLALLGGGLGVLGDSLNSNITQQDGSVACSLEYFCKCMNCQGCTHRIESRCM